MAENSVVRRENCRVLKWIVERIEGTGKAEYSPLGYIPAPGALDLSGLKISEEDVKKLFEVNKEDWLQEVESIKQHQARFGDRMPIPLLRETHDLVQRLKK